MVGRSDPARRARRASCVLLLSVAIALACAGRQGPAAPAADVPPKRIEFSILEDYDKGESLEEIAKDFDLFHELGVTTWRGSFGWDDYEPSRGAYDFEWLHRFADLAASRGITLRPYLGYTPAWAAAGGADRDAWNDPPSDVDAWQRFVRTLAADMRRHRNIVSYEIYNEENVAQWWDGTPQAYREVLGRAAEAIEAGNPDAQLLVGGMVYPDIEWIATMCEDGGSGRLVSAIPFHAYPETWTPPEVTVENYLGPSFESGFVREADEACGRKPIWINETGYATTPGRTESDQAQWWVRAIATFAAAPRIEHIGIYEIKDLRPDRAAIGDTPNYHLGLTKSDRGKKLAFGTVAQLVSMLGGRSIVPTEPRVTVSEGTPAADVYRHLLRRDDGHDLLFLWTRLHRAVVDVTVPQSTSRAIEYRLDGRRSGELRIVDGALRGITLEPGEVRFFELAPN